VYGTTGYDFLASANNLFVARTNVRAFDRVYRRFSGFDTAMPELSETTKMLIMRNALASEINALAHELERISERSRYYRDFTLEGLRTALRQVMAVLGVYRTYIDPRSGEVSERDRHFVEQAVRLASERLPNMDETIFDYIRDSWLLRNLDAFRSEDRDLLGRWLLWFQQMTGPVMAKGVEDTAFYRYNRLVSLNEVGGHPAQFGAGVEDFHRDNRQKAEHWPHATLATSTHDNKRSEDVRARISVLSELPDVWRRSIVRWARLNVGRKTELNLAAGPYFIAPDRNDEYLLYQTLLGAWPVREDGGGPDPIWGTLAEPDESPPHQAFVERMVAYMAKATKEAKVHTSWINPDEEYDDALANFIRAILRPGVRNRFLMAFAPLARLVAYHGQVNALSQVLLKLASPGVPDVYQGNELWDFSLVDPDNRRPVDYERRQAVLREPMPTHGQLLTRSSDGRIKLFVTQRLLDYRRHHRELFERGAYLPAQAGGDKAAHAVAFVRKHDNNEMLVIAPRLSCTLVGEAERRPIAEIWADTWMTLPAGVQGRRFRNLFTGAVVETTSRNGSQVLLLGEALSEFPLAALVQE
jgi:(1->4)-alpha-D-glucan 1-alpha-D-glucosylmutase